MADIWFCLPHSGQTIPGPWHTALEIAVSKDHRLHMAEKSFGCLTHNFNMGWAACYNARKDTNVSHFMMMHSDHGAVENAAQILLDEMKRVDADIISVAAALGDERGLTSTGVVRRGHRDVRRLTFKEIYDLPETFSIADMNEKDDKILVINTGLWLMRFDPLLWRKFPGFKIENQMYYNAETDKMTAAFYSEDWLFSEWADSMGLKVFCTRAVGDYHEKPFKYPNTHVWGTSDYDQEYATLQPSGEFGHLGGSTRPGSSTPNGDPQSWCPPVWDALIAEGAKTVLDVGCGCGFAARYFESKGCEVLGIEGDVNALSQYKGKSAVKHDFIRGVGPVEKDYDLAWCCEVVEHVEDQYERFILGTLAYAKTIAMTHALPGQTGVHHVNCQMPDYWIKRVESLGYEYDESTTKRLKESVNHGSTEGMHFARSGLIFRRKVEV